MPAGARSPLLALLVGLVLLAPVSGAAADPPAARGTDEACPPDRVPEDLFDDVPAADVHESAVDCIVWWGLARGRTSSQYAPAAAVDRGQLATYVVRLVLESGGRLPAGGSDRFADDDGSPHEPSIDRLAEAGIVSGRADGRYDPRGRVTRAEMAALLVRAYEHRTGRSLPTDGDHFGDDDGTTHESSIDAAAGAGFTSGTGDGRFSPDGPVPRGAMGSFLARVLDLLVEDGHATPPRTAPGELDASFGDQGVQRFAVPSSEDDDEAADVALDRTGRVVVVGDDFSVVRLRSDGSPDEGFGRGGAVTGAFGPDAQALAVGVQEDGGVVVGGLAPVGATYQVALARYTADGRLDPTFGGSGRVVTDFRFGSVLRDLAVLPDGRIVAAVITGSSDDSRSHSDVAVLRYRSDGSLDSTFGDGGRVVTDVRGSNDYVRALVVRPDGAVLVAGDAFAPLQRIDAPTDVVWAVLRYRPDGSLDPSFGEDGKALIDLGEGFEMLAALALQADGSVVAAGSVGSAGGLAPAGVAVARLTPGGRRDPAFGSDGVVVTRPARYAEGAGVVVQPDGMLLVAGRASDDAPGALPWEWALLRYRPDGGLDPELGGDGVVLADVGRDANAAALQPDGRLVVVGCDCPEQGAAGSAFVAARFHTADGPAG